MQVERRRFAALGDGKAAAGEGRVRERWGEEGKTESEGIVGEKRGTAEPSTGAGKGLSGGRVSNA